MDIEPAVDIEKQSLKLPYDYAQTPGTLYERGEFSQSLPSSVQEFLIQLNKSDQRCTLVAAVVGWCYRYTGQAEIPLDVSIYDGPHQTSNQHITLTEVEGTRVFSELENSVETELLKESKEDAEGVQLSVLFSDQALNQSDRTAEIQVGFIITNQSCDLQFIYNQSLLDESTIRRMVTHLIALLEFVIEKPDTQIADIQIFKQEELDWFLKNCSGTVQKLSELLLTKDIEAHANFQPQKLAVSFQNQKLSYQQLNEQANRLAHYLISQGVTAESRVMVCLEPSLEIAVSLLAILKVGAAYVPLNPAYPEYRIKIMVEDTEPNLVLCSSKSQHLDFGVAPSLVLDQTEALSTLPSDNPNVTIDAQQTAYIYYTSGTTGKPKGSMGSYANLCHYIRVSQERYQFNRQEIMPAMANYTFSISMFELMSPLVAGGTLHILQREQVLDLDFMMEVLQKVTFIHAGPSLLKSLAKYIEQKFEDYSVFQNLRHLSSGGDMVPPDLLEKLRLIFSQTELFVIYGCSEIGCMGVTHFYPTDQAVHKTFVGRPFTNVHLKLLDDDQNTVPIGVIGEVYFGGGGVAKGYLNRPQLTKERFFEEDDVRFYRTGDMGRLDVNGNLELLGRRDFQVHIRGMRIELGEVEYHLRQAPGVRDGAVIARAHGGSENLLVAFYVNESNPSVRPESLRDYIARRVPDYMVPSYFLELEALPLNVNMKVDRRALQSTELKIATTGNEPSTATEIALAAIWCQLLKRDQVGLEDNFLIIGGDSLLAMELIGTIKDEMGVKIDGMDVLRESLQVMARIIDEKSGRIIPGESPAGGALIVDVNPVKTFFFGPDNSLYGLLHQGQNGSAPYPVLVCTPITEFKRCHFIIKSLCDAVANNGVTILRFDYFGTGDAQGFDEEATIDRWIEDVRAAHDHLKQLTNAEKVVVFGSRLGALLAFNALEDKEIHKFIFWDPVYDGEDYYQKLSEMHKTKVWRARTLRRMPVPQDLDPAKEMMGFTYSKEALDRLRQLKIRATHQEVIDYVLTQDVTLDPGNNSDHQNFHYLDLNCEWFDPVSHSSAITERKLYEDLLLHLNYHES